MAQQKGSAVTSNNIANAATKGYHRQSATFVSRGDRGGGVDVDSVRRIIDDNLERRLNTQVGSDAHARARLEELSVMESTFGEMGENDIQARLQNFFGAFRELAAAPDDLTVRRQVLGVADFLASGIRNTATSLSKVKTDIDEDVAQLTQDANRMIGEIARLNDLIAQARGNGLDEASDLQDERGNVIHELSELTGADVIIDHNGYASVTIGNGITVVQQTQAREIQTEFNPTSGTLDLFVESGSRIDLNSRIKLGRIGGLLQVRDFEVDEHLANLDQFATDLAQSVNGVHRAHLDLDGNTNVNFFDAPLSTSGAALSLTVNAAIANAPRAVAVAVTAATVPGDGRGATAVSDLEDALVTAGNTQTLGSSLSDMITRIGHAVRTAQTSKSYEQSRIEHFENLRESTSGVSLQEQMIQMMQYQRAFQATSKVISTVDTMLDALMSIAR